MSGAVARAVCPSTGADPRSPRRGPGTLVALAIALALGACRSSGDEHPSEPPSGEPPSGSGVGESSERPVSDASAGLPDLRAHSGSASCTPCHEEQARALAGSSHALAARPLDGARAIAADFGADSPVDPVQLRSEPPAQVVADAAGEPAPRPVSHVLGGRRREDFLTAHGGAHAVLPLSWSVTRGEWIDALSDERGIEATPGSAWAWDGKQRRWEEACSRCHPSPAAASGPAVPNAPEEAAPFDGGIGCETCHGPGARHAALAERDLPSAGAVVRAAPDAFSGCAHCHLSGARLPLLAGEALRASDAVLDHLIPAAFVGPAGVDPRFRSDGRPGTAHGMAVQSWAQSPCFQVGGASCLHCHDPHGGGLRDPDPDASCRGCHAELAASSEEHHAGHPVASGPVPLAAAEPGGPDPQRLPGCVDCHLPASLELGSADRARDHAVSIPEPLLREETGAPDACAACHAELEPRALAESLDRTHPDRTRERLSRARAFRRAFELSAGRATAPAAGVPAAASAEIERSASELAAILAAESDPWLRAGIARLIGGLGPPARPAAGELLDAAVAGDPALARAAAAALARTGGGDRLRLLELAREHEDWRVRVPAAAALGAGGDPRGSAELEVLRADDALPVEARAEATFELGLLLLRRGLLERASFALEEATRLAPDFAPAWLSLGVARAGAGDAEGARLAWLTVLDLEPGHALASANLRKLASEQPGP